MESDVKNNVQYSLIGGKRKLFKDIVPHIFPWDVVIDIPQENIEPEKKDKNIQCPANTVMSNEHQIDILPRILEYQFFLKRTSI